MAAPAPMMKKLLSILLLAQALGAGATHWLTYYVYIETEYVQGPWSGAHLLNSSRYRYLAVREYTDLFGTERIDQAEKMLQRLGENDPSAYDWDYALYLRGDTVLIKTEQAIRAWDRVWNEVTATLTLNGFSAVLFELSDTQVKTTLADLTLPYFDLVDPRQKSIGSRTISGLPGPPGQLPANTADPGRVKQKDRPFQSLAIWLILSVVLNISLTIILLIQRKR